MRAETKRLVDRLTDAAIKCRAKRFHDWEPETASRVLGGFETWETCARGCGVRRYSILSNTGQVLKRRPIYPTGKDVVPYLIPGARFEAEDLDAIRLLVFHWDFDAKMQTPTNTRSGGDSDVA